MPDGSRKRRHSDNLAKRRWYAWHRARRFRRRFWVHPEHSAPPPACPVVRLRLEPVLV